MKESNIASTGKMSSSCFGNIGKKDKHIKKHCNSAVASVLLKKAEQFDEIHKDKTRLEYERHLLHRECIILPKQFCHPHTTTAVLF